MARSSSTIGVFNDLFLGDGSYAHSDIVWVGDTANPGVASPDTVQYEEGDIVFHGGHLWVAARQNDNVEPTTANSMDWTQATAGDGGTLLSHFSTAGNVDASADGDNIQLNIDPTFIDAAPARNSNNLITSNGVFLAVQNAMGATVTITTDVPLDVNNIQAGHQYTAVINSTGAGTITQITVALDGLVLGGDQNLNFNNNLGVQGIIEQGTQSVTFTLRPTDVSNIQINGDNTGLVFDQPAIGDPDNPDNVPFPITATSTGGALSRILVESDGTEIGDAHTLNFINSTITESDTEVRIQINPSHQAVLQGVTSFPRDNLSSLQPDTRYSLEVFNRTGQTVTFRNDGDATAVTHLIRITAGTVVHNVEHSRIRDESNPNGTVVFVEDDRTGQLSFTLSEIDVNSFGALSAELVDEIVLVEQSTGLEFPVFHIGAEQDTTQLQLEIDHNSEEIAAVDGRVDTLNAKVDSLLYSNGVAHYDEVATALVSSAFRDTTNSIYDGHSLNFLVDGGNLAFNNNAAYRPFPGQDGGGVTLAANNRLVNSLGSTVEHGVLNTNALLDAPNNHRERGLATVTWLNSTLNPVFNHIYERRLEEAGARMWFPFNLTGFGDRTFVNPVVPVGGVDRVVQPDVDAAQLPGGVSVYDPSTNLLVPGISRASVSSAGTAAVQLNFQDADGNAATLPGGRLYFVVYRPDFSVGPNNDYTRKDDAVETFLTAMNNIYETQTFPTMRDAVRSYWQSGWQIRYPTRATVAMGGIVSIVAQLALPGQRFDQNGNGAHNGFDFAITNTSTNPNIEGTIAPTGQVRIWDSQDNLDSLERFLSSTPAPDTIHCHFMDRAADGTVTDLTEASAVTVFRGIDAARPFAIGRTGTTQIPGLARRQDNPLVSQSNANGNFTRVGVRELGFIDIYLDRALRNFPIPGTTFSLIDDRTQGLTDNLFNGYTQSNNPQANFVPHFSGTLNTDGSVATGEITWEADDDTAPTGGTGITVSAAREVALDPRGQTFELFMGVETLGTTGTLTGGITNPLVQGYFDQFLHAVYGRWFWFPNQNNGNGAWSDRSDFTAADGTRFGLDGTSL
ncbi:MAG: hypothetical protein MPJ08_09250 [Nitrosopumilus sp.]|nr:hypothetical protein [Nitrosopumilus sp.]